MDSGDRDRTEKVLAELQQADLITSEECKAVNGSYDVVEIQSTKSPGVMVKTAEIMRRHGYENKANFLTVLSELQQAGLIPSEDCVGIRGSYDVVADQSGKSPEVMIKIAEILRQHGFESQSKFLTALVELQQADLITCEECEGKRFLGEVVGVQSGKSPEIMVKSAEILMKLEFHALSVKLLPALAELQQSDLITREECEGLSDFKRVFEIIQAVKSPVVVVKSAEILRKHGFQTESTKFIEVLAELQQADLITSEECKWLQTPSELVSIQGGKTPEVRSRSAEILRKHGHEEEATMLTVLVELQQADLITGEDCRGLCSVNPYYFSLSEVVKLQTGKSPEVMSKTADVLSRKGFEQESRFLSVLVELLQAGLITKWKCEQLRDIYEVTQMLSTKSPEVTTKTADVLKRNGFEKESRLLLVIADLVQANIIDSWKLSEMWDISDVVKHQCNKSPEVVTRTADVLRSHECEKEFKLLSVLVELRQDDLISSEVCGELSDISDVVAVQSGRSPEAITKSADVLKRIGFEKESNLLSALAELQQADLFTGEECDGLWDISQLLVVSVQSEKSPEEVTKTADVLSKYGFEKESKLLSGQDILKFETHYSRVVSTQASITLKIAKCTTIGPPRIGKTCLKHLLTGQEWDVEKGTASTDVMEAPEWVECYSVEEGGAEQLWKLLSAEQKQGELIRAVNAFTASSTQLTTTTSDVPPTTKPGDAPPTIAFSEDQPTVKPNEAPPTIASSETQFPINPIDADQGAVSPSAVPPTTTPSDTSPRPTPKSAPPPSAPPTTTTLSAVKSPATVWGALNALAGACSREDLQNILDDNEGRVLGETRLIHFIDTGGQAIYHDVHPVLITSPSVYLVVFSLKELYQKSDVDQLKYFKSDLIQRPLRSIYTFGTKNPQEEEHLELHAETPKIFIVGTHLDQIPPGDSQEQFLHSLDKVIESEIGNKPYCQFVQYDPKGLSFWAVDNTQAGRELDKDRKYITTLRRMVQEGSMGMSVKVPLAWMLLKLVMDGKGERYCKYSKLMEEARIRGYVREHAADADLDSMVRLFHILGLLYHKVPSSSRYDKNDSLVFINPDCLYSATSDFLMAAKEEIADSDKDLHQTQASAKEELEYSQGGSEEDRHQISAATKGEMYQDEEVDRKGNEQQKPVPKGIVQKEKVLRRVQCNSENILHEMAVVLQFVKSAMVRIGHDPTEAVLKSLHDQLVTSSRKIGQQHKLSPMESQNASSVKAKQQLFLGRLVHILQSTVEAVLSDSGWMEEAHVREVVDKAVKRVEAQYQSRFIENQDMDQVLSILSDLRVVAELNNSDTYVVPAALPNGPSVNTCGSAAPILVTVVSQTIMEVCYLPSGLFCCLISELAGLGWTVIPRGRTHIAFAFTHEGRPQNVHITECESYIKVEMELEASLQELSETCQCVKEMIHMSIVNVYKELFSDPTAGSTFEESLVWGFQCEDHLGDETHIAAFQEDDYECCAKCLIKPFGIQDVKPEQFVWFGNELDDD